MATKASTRTERRVRHEARHGVVPGHVCHRHWRQDADGQQVRAREGRSAGAVWASATAELKALGLDSELGARGWRSGRAATCSFSRFGKNKASSVRQCATRAWTAEWLPRCTTEMRRFAGMSKRASAIAGLRRRAQRSGVGRTSLRRPSTRSRRGVASLDEVVLLRHTIESYVSTPRNNMFQYFIRKLAEICAQTEKYRQCAFRQHFAVLPTRLATPPLSLRSAAQSLHMSRCGWIASTRAALPTLP